MDVIKEVDRLERKWQDRTAAMKKWYKVIELDNHLEQHGMESVISPDPLTAFKMATWLLKPKEWTVKFDTEGFDDESLRNIGGLERVVERELRWHQRKGAKKLHGSVMKHMLDMFVTTGWLCFAYFPGEKHWMLNPLHPATVFPEYNEDGELVGLGRKYRIYNDAMRSYLGGKGWLLPQMANSTYTNAIVRSLWKMEGGVAWHGVAVDRQETRAMSPTELFEIPVYCYPGGGLPDNGVLSNTKWIIEVGQALVAGIMELQKNLDRMSTYMQQILRDVANNVTVTRTRSGESPVTPENRWKRGMIYDIGLGEDIYNLAPPPLPPEMRTHGLDMRQSWQRNLFPDATVGNFNQSVSTYLMSQATAGTQQALDPFHERFVNGISAMIDSNIQMTRDAGLDVLGFNARKLPEDLLANFFYQLSVPGDFIMRANSARIVNPRFRLSQQTLTEVLFPEVKSATDEQNKLSVEDAADTELFRMILSIKNYRRAAADAFALGDRESEKLFMSAVRRLERMVEGAQGGPESTLLGNRPGNLRQLVEEMG